MIRRISQKISAVFFWLHRIFGRYGDPSNSVTPYRLKKTGSKGKPKILHVNGNFVIGGTSQMIVDLIENTSDSFSHQIIVPATPDVLPYQPLSIQAFPVTQLPQLYEWLKKEKPDLVHIHYWVRPEHQYVDFGIWYSAVFKMCGELGLNIIQNINVPTRPFPSSSVLHNVFVSEYVKNEFNDQELIPSSVIYPGSDLELFNNEIQVEPPFTIGMVYRLDPDKLNPEAIEVFIRALKKDPDLSCMIIGGGTYFHAYKQRVKKEGLTSRFTFTGYVAYNELPSFYKKLGLVVAPVHDESFGQVTPFAMGMGLPVAGYDTGALREILGSDETLVKTGDTDALADLIVDLMKNREKRRSLGRANQERARRKFSLAQMIQGYQTLYETHVSKVALAEYS